MYGAFLREMSDLVKIKIALEDPLLELVGDLDRLGVVPDGGIHDGNALGTGVSPATGGRRSREAGDGASLSTGTHVVGPIEALCKNKNSQHDDQETLGESTPAAPEEDTNLDDPVRRRSGPKSSSPRLRLLLV